MKLNGHGDHGAGAPAGRATFAERTTAIAESVDVRVDVFIGDTVLSIGSLNRLKSGEILPLDASLADLVELRVNGIRVATGELVSVGDRFGVRITEIA